MIKNYLLLLFLVFHFSLKAQQVSKAIQVAHVNSVGCAPSTSWSDLDIGNVRARILINGDMWNDLNGTAKYEVPKGSGKNSMSAGAFWIGGKESGGNLKLAAQTYRQGGSDFWPGPIDTNSVTIDSMICHAYDRHWKITRQEVADFINGGTPSQTIIDWPGNSNPNSNGSLHLAPFYDANGDGIYNYTQGDYPKYEFGTQSPNIYERLNGDQTIWWVFNDVGNIHSETNGNSIGIEVHAQAFAFCTNDTDLSNTTFYQFKIINRASSILYQTYFGAYADVDLGNSNDDYIGCDVTRNFGYGYNGDSYDDSPTGYGNHLAAIGVDVLQGPLADSPDFKDNDFNGITDEPGESINMSGFIFYGNDASVQGNPTAASDFYQFLDGQWKDASPMVYGGTGYNPNNTTVTASFAFPGNSDPNHYGTSGVNYGFDWTESNPDTGLSVNIPSDRRFIMSTGKFTMQPGEINYYIRAAVWAQINDSIPDSSITALQRSDDRIQSFFDSHFNNIATCVVTIGIDELSPDEFSVYPSPATDYLMIHLKDQSTKMQVDIYSTDGKLIYHSNEFNNELNVDVKKWSSGSYYYRLHNGTKHASGKISILN
jgi:hypothetical protein